MTPRDVVSDRGRSVFQLGGDDEVENRIGTDLSILPIISAI
jgi:S1-C subfamily serine protease